ncbi:MAG TPA: immunoglobulin domain-containing protein [Candidatus Paceibacterota bacterium]|nr:immunoglobulin domain-containing protein [Verrucomicrobiota bacterium]HSA09846.1 immunoglobulin domain-containing protein [Candidatus Paceibacterota bacterium]
MSSRFLRAVLPACFLAIACCALSGMEDRMVDESLIPKLPPSPDWSSIDVPPQDPGKPIAAPSYGPIAPAARQPAGALSGKLVFMNCGHGWTYLSSWVLLRPELLEMNEDYGNIDQLNMFATYCFNAGAVVIPCRPLGYQNNEVVLDNDATSVAFAGTWFNSLATNYFYGTTGDVAYRYANLSDTETATATYTPTIPAAGYYPVYCWASHGGNRGDQLYRIIHTGGESQVRIPHYRVGNGWVYLGEYYFNAGANAAVGAVIVSNLRSSTNGSVVIADAIRFGNGMGSINRGGGISNYPREEENCRYWVEAGLGVGMPTSIYDSGSDDQRDSWSTPPQISAEMNRAESGTVNDRIHISFHSNAGGGRGTVALITGDPTPNQAELAQICGAEVNNDLVALGSPPLEFPWHNNTTVTYSGGYSEIDGRLFDYEMPATIIEVAYHDDETDVALLKDAKARAAVGKAAMHGVVKYMDTYGSGPLAFLPEPPTNPRALGSTNGDITLRWAVPPSVGGSQAPTNYVIYRSTNGYGFGHPVSVGNVTSYTVSGLAAGTDYYFRITAANAGGESLPSEVVGCRTPATSDAPRVLVVNGFDRFDRTTNLRMNIGARNYGPPDGSGAIERVWPRRVNAFDYVVPHGKAISAHGMAFDSCQNEAITSNLVQLSNYNVVIWACGNETVAGETFSSAEQSRVSAYLAGGGRLFASGANIAYDLDRVSGPTTADRNFLHEQLRVAFANDNSAIYTAVSVAGAVFAGRASSTIDDGSGGIYWVQSPDVVAAYGPGTAPALNYSGGSAAAVQYDGSAGGGRVVFFGFPFETITSSTRRNQYMSDILTFLMLPLATNVAAAIITPPANGTAYQGSNATLTVTATGTQPVSYQWRFNGENVAGATTSVLTRSPAQTSHSGNYDVVVSNAFGMATSQVATLVIYLYPEVLYSDNFDVSTAGNWTLNRSSADTRVTFNWNYGALGIPSAPGAGGTTRGLKCEANMANGVAAALSLSPVGRSFSGNYRLRFNLWMNANGPFPAGGTGSTQHGTAGVGTAGTSVLWTGSGTTADGTWFAADGEGQAGDTTGIADFCAFSGTAIQGVATGVYAAGTASNARGNLNSYYAAAFPGGQTAPSAQSQTGALEVGSIGFAWRDVMITKQGTTVEWAIDGLRIATVSSAALPGSNISLGYWDYYASLSDNTNLSFGVFDNVRVERLTSNAPPYITSQPQSQMVKAGSTVTFGVVAGGVPAPSYQWRLDGTPIPGATASSYSRANVQTGGVYCVAVANAGGLVTSADALLTVSLPLPSKFDVVSVLPDGRVRFVLSGEPGSYEIETSANLSQWSTFTNLTIVTDTIEFTGDSSTNAPQRFYRAKSGPQGP